MSNKLPTIGDDVKIIYPDGTLGSITWSIKRYALHGNCVVCHGEEQAIVSLDNLIIVDHDEYCDCRPCKEALEKEESDAYDLLTAHKS